MAFVSFSEVFDCIVRPLICLRQQHSVRVFRVDMCAELFQDLMGFRQVFAAGPLALNQVGDCVEAKSVDSEIEPEIDHLEQRLFKFRIIPIHVRLMRKETMPIIGPC